MPPDNDMLPSPPPPSIRPPLSGGRVFLYFLGFFLAIILVNAVYVFLATSSNPGTVTEDAYEKGLAYNKVIEKAQAQDTLGWRHTLTIRIDENKKYRVALRMRNHKNGFLTHAGAVVRFFRPVEGGEDFDVTLQETRPGTYLALTEFPESGIWDAYIAVRRGDDIYRAHDRVVVH